MKVLVTAGSVYGQLDDNKLVSNRSRGIWAERFAEHLARQGHDATLLIADISPLPQAPAIVEDLVGVERYQIVRHKGFQDYRRICLEMAKEVDAMVLAAAVVNWIPASPVKGKMPTKGYKAGDIVNIPFMLAPHVIDEMKQINPKLTLVGCKMLSGATNKDLIDAAYDVVLRARCNVVVANDLSNLRQKFLVYPDRSVQARHMDDPEGPSLFYADLLHVLQDEHYSTVLTVNRKMSLSVPQFNRIVDKYRGRFVIRQSGVDRVFGAVCVPLGGSTGHVVSPREKGMLFTDADAVLVSEVRDRQVFVSSTGTKATLNAPLLVRVAKQYNRPVLHLHEQLAGFPTVPYAPPGTARDNEREVPGPVFNIEGHGFIACLDPDTLETLS